MNVKLLTGHHLEILSLKVGCTGSSKPTLAWVEVFRINPEFRILRLTFLRNAELGRFG